MIDPGGIHSSTAQKIGEEGHTVYYYVPWQSAYAHFIDFAPGTGLPNITKVMDWAPYIDQVDCIIFPDVGMGALASWLRKKGYTVFGAGDGEVMEMDRIKSVEVMTKLDIKCPETQVFHGVSEAMKFIESVIGPSETNQLSDGKYFVKFNVWRGDCDSFPVESVEQCKEMFSKLRASIGPYADEIPVIIQTKSEGVETGCDLFFNGNEFIKPYMIGCESGSSYIGYITDNLGFMTPSVMKAAEYLKSVNYRGAFSTEVIYDGKDCSWIDWTTRFPMPLGLLYSHFIPNFGEFIYSIAKGESPKTSLPKGKYLGIADFSSENAIDDWLPLSHNEHTQLLRPMVVNNQYYSVPGISTLGVVLGQGDNFTDVKRDLEKNAEDVSAFFGKIETNFLDGVMDKYINPISKLGGVEVFGPGAHIDKVESKEISRAARLSRFLDE